MPHTAPGGGGGGGLKGGSGEGGPWFTITTTDPVTRTSDRTKNYETMKERRNLCMNRT